MNRQNAGQVRTKYTEVLGEVAADLTSIRLEGLARELGVRSKGKYIGLHISCSEPMFEDIGNVDVAFYISRTTPKAMREKVLSNKTVPHTRTRTCYNVPIQKIMRVFKRLSIGLTNSYSLDDGTFKPAKVNFPVVT